MKILVVDDERDVQVLFEQRFRKEIKSGEMDFVFAFSGEEAMEMMKDYEHEAVLILSDINMPGMSGLELLRNIKIKYETPPSISGMLMSVKMIDMSGCSAIFFNASFPFTAKTNS